MLLYFVTILYFQVSNFYFNSKTISLPGFVDKLSSTCGQSAEKILMWISLYAKRREWSYILLRRIGFFGCRFEYYLHFFNFRSTRKYKYIMLVIILSILSVYTDSFCFWQLVLRFYLEPDDCTPASLAETPSYLICAFNHSLPRKDEKKKKEISVKEKKMKSFIIKRRWKNNILFFMYTETLHLPFGCLKFNALNVSDIGRRSNSRENPGLIVSFGYIYSLENCNFG